MKKLSICMVGRNDDYMPDFIYRITTTLNFIAESARIADVLSQLELVVVDWKSQEPLSTVVPLSKEAKQITRFVYVEKDEYSRTPYSDLYGLQSGAERRTRRVCFVMWL